MWFGHRPASGGRLILCTQLWTVDRARSTSNISRIETVFERDRPKRWNCSVESAEGGVIAPLLDRAYKTVHTVIREVEAAVQRGFPVVWKHLDQIIDGPTQVDESGRVCSGYKGQESPRNSRSRGGSSQSGRSRWQGRHGD